MVMTKAYSSGRPHQMFDYTTSSCLTFPLEYALVITISHYLKHKDAILDTFVSCTLYAVSLYDNAYALFYAHACCSCVCVSCT